MQIYGGPGDRIDTIYRRVSPLASTAGAVVQTTIKDRAGNIRTFFYDARNRLVLKREYTGRADSHRVMNLELGDNIAGKPLRETDPAYFETRYEYNDDSLCTRIVDPEGTVEQYCVRLRELERPRSRSDGWARATGGASGGRSAANCRGV